MAMSSPRRWLLRFSAPGMTPFMFLRASVACVRMWVLSTGILIITSLSSAVLAMRTESITSAFGISHLFRCIRIQVAQLDTKSLGDLGDTRRVERLLRAESTEIVTRYGAVADDQRCGLPLQHQLRNCFHHIGIRHAPAVPRRRLALIGLDEDPAARAPMSSSNPPASRTASRTARSTFSV